MSTIAQISADLLRGEDYYRILTDQWLQELKKGCNCKPKEYECLGMLIDALQNAVATEIIPSEITEINYKEMLLIIGSAVVKIPPTVNAGADQTKQASQSAVFNAVATQGSAAITGYLWTKLSGGSVLMTGTTTSQLTVTGFSGDMPLGVYEFQITVTDANGLTAFDTVKLTVTANNLVAYFGDLATKQTLNESQIEIGSQVTFTPNGNVTVPYSVPTLRFLWFAIPSGQPVKNYYIDLANSLNQGSMGTEDDLYGAPVTVGAYDYYITNYLTSYFVAVPPRGLQFKTI